MTFIKRTTVLLFGLYVLTGCNPSSTEPFPGDVRSMDELIAPEEFSYSLWRTTDLDVFVDAPLRFGRVNIQVYGVSSNNLELLFQGQQAVHDTNSISFKHGHHYDKLVTQVHFLDGEQASSTVGKDVSFVRVERIETEDPFENTASLKTNGLDCETCTTAITSGSGAYTVGANDTLCIDGSSSVSVNVGNGGHLQLCGTHSSMGDIVLGEGASLALSANGSMSFSSGSGLTIGVGAEVVLKEQTNFIASRSIVIGNQSSWTSYGDIHIDGHLDVEDSSSFISFGNCLVKGHIEVTGAQSKLINYGSMSTIVNDHIRVTNSGQLENYCHIHSDQNIWIEQSGQFTNHNQMDCDHKLKMNDGGILSLMPSSISISQDLQLYDALIKNEGLSTAVLKVWDDALYYQGATIFGFIDVCIQGLNQNVSKLSISNNAQFSCANAIPPSACITIGHDPSLDDDGDGISNILDPFPQDSSRALKVCEVASTLVFEDNWPYRGDYDFNDLVMSYQIWAVANRNSKIKDIAFAFKMRARGAAYKNGFGIEFNTVPSNLVSPDFEVANTTTTSAIVLGDVSSVLGAWNTDSTYKDSFVDVPWDTIVFTFATPIHDSVLATFNPFLIIDEERGREVHLIDHHPTPLADPTLLGSGDDASNGTSGEYYHTDQNQPWALQLPIIFDYPYERVDITRAYLNFDNWATSGGSVNEDWYDSTKPGNAKGRKIHKENK